MSLSPLLPKKLSSLHRLGFWNAYLTSSTRTRQHCPCRWCELIDDRTRQFSAVLNIFETEQLQLGNWVETRQNSVHAAFRDRTKLSPIHFTPPSADTDKIRQDKTAMSRPCRRWEINRNERRHQAYTMSNDCTDARKLGLFTGSGQWRRQDLVRGGHKVETPKASSPWRRRRRWWGIERGYRPPS